MNIIDFNARDAVTIVPSDTVSIATTPVSIYVGGTGALTVVTEASYFRARGADVAATDATIIAAATTVVFTGVPVGFVLPCRVKAVKATGTTATLLVGFLP